MLTPNHIVSTLRERVRLVEKKLGQWERPGAVINVPALNELRYSLVHLLRYLCDEPEAVPV